MFTLEEYAQSSVPKTYLRRLAGCLVSCINDQRYDAEDGDYHFADGIRYQFAELLVALDIPEKWHPAIYAAVRCPECNARLDALSDVSVDFTLQEQQTYTKTIERLSRKTRPRLDAFYNYLRQYPYLGALHPVGKALVKDIQSLNKITVNDALWFRAREVGESKIYTQKDMEPPPADAVIKEGRFNHYGQSHFYLSKTESVCAVEGSHDKSCICWIQKVHINRVDAILDLTEDYYKYYNYSGTDSLPTLPLSVAGLLLSGSITQAQKSAGSWKPEYFVPRFIADVCKSQGINGIQYPSTLTYGTNLVIFDFSRLDCTFAGEPYLYKYRKRN